jgi:hypothetical protein
MIAVFANASCFCRIRIPGLMECLDKNMLYIPVSDMESEEYAISKEDKRLTKEFYKK